MSSSELSMLLNVFLLTIVLAVRMQPIAIRAGLVDHPDARKRHEAPTPLCGGLAILGALAITDLLDPGALSAQPVTVICFLLIVAIGVADDRWGVNPAIRLAAQTLAAVVIVSQGALARPNLAGLLDWAPLAPALGSVVAVSLMVGLINSINMIDGLDGLAGSVALSAFVWLGLMAIAVGDAPTALRAELMMAATAGFLALNVRHAWRDRALVFLGDGGSTMLGAAIAYLILLLCSGVGGVGGVPLPSLLWLVAVPVIDTLSLIVRRVAVGQSPFAGDRRHLHHLLLDRGLSPAAATGAIAAATFLCGAVGYASFAWEVPALVTALGLALPAAAHTAIVLGAGGAGSASRSREFAPLSLLRGPAGPIGEPPSSHVEG